MNCNRCGNNPCTCTPPWAIQGRDIPCATCGQGVALPAPNWSAEVTCEEDGRENTLIQQLAFAATIQSAWVVPACGQTATVQVEGSTAIVVGTYFWNPSFGYFQVSSYNGTTGEVVLKNVCRDGNAAPGTTVIALSQFDVGAPPTDVDSGITSIFPYLAIDFTAPSNSDCSNITVTSVAGLVIGNTVQISTGIYLLNAVIGANTLQICNQGSGIIPGTVVFARDAGNNLQYPIITINSDPCTNPRSTALALLGCSSGVQSILQGPYISDTLNYNVVPCLTDFANMKASYQVLNAGTLNCSTLASGFAAVPGTTNYNIVVVSSAPFAVGQALTIPGTPLRFTITGISGTTLITTTTNPGATYTFGIGNPICPINCCEYTKNILNGLQMGLGSSQQINGAGTIDARAGHNTYTTPQFTLGTLTNNNANRNLSISAGVQVKVFGVINNASDSSFTINFRLVGQQDALSPFDLINENNTYACNVATAPQDKNLWCGVLYGAAPGVTVGFKFNVVITIANAAASAGNNFAISQCIVGVGHQVTTL